MHEAVGTPGSDATTYLELYATEMSAKPEVIEVSQPEMTIREVPMLDGTLVQFVEQNLTYTVEEGSTYRSRYLARPVDGVMMALQYVEPEGEFSEEQRDVLTKDVSIWGLVEE